MAMIGTAATGPKKKASTGNRMIDEPVPITPLMTPAKVPTTKTRR